MITQPPAEESSLPINHHLLLCARQVPSPNHDARPNPTDISLVVIHCISLPPGEFGGPHIDRLFCNQLNPDDHPFFAEIQTLRVSAHLLIGREGDITQYVPFNRRAWHAGVSRYRDRERCNDFAIGIELEGTVDNPYTDKQYLSLAATLKALLASYPSLSSERIAGHSDIAPDRKSDPGPFFDWRRLRQLLAGD
ncbi:1,6-anhydro-N-acetylmuramyl-L-alanine amidase AmpD [Methylomonas sp. UP202]|uniref:1,6-anhydro-N-acetylmuramyl-L-alanine amidase AmpD n=1 Tax=Methylomonas sp. UP202 TaxID=3040943 RepID=UPI0024792EB1|nr:1,6-anhydro-N-acetylmuramyl-L-alanine amidase AmpD [Methylomonas sp. UP202]WGS85994.1 1,6-anhydro-N-acetylmuramyl-L-alanine amidase AmpD [Methylomonas sp. UP202]